MATLLEKVSQLNKKTATTTKERKKEKKEERRKKVNIRAQKFYVSVKYLLL